MHTSNCMLYLPVFWGQILKSKLDASLILNIIKLQQCNFLLQLRVIQSLHQQEEVSILHPTVLRLQLYLPVMLEPVYSGTRSSPVSETVPGISQPLLVVRHLTDFNFNFLYRQASANSADPDQTAPRGAV